VKTIALLTNAAIGTLDGHDLSAPVSTTPPNVTLQSAVAYIDQISDLLIAGIQKARQTIARALPAQVVEANLKFRVDDLFQDAQFAVAASRKELHAAVAEFNRSGLISLTPQHLKDLFSQLPDAIPDLSEKFKDWDATLAVPAFVNDTLNCVKEAVVAMLPPDSLSEEAAKTINGAIDSILGSAKIVTALNTLQDSITKEAEKVCKKLGDYVLAIPEGKEWIGIGTRKTIEDFFRHLEQQTSRLLSQLGAARVSRMDLTC
jgi:hypothetical protein